MYLEFLQSYTATRGTGSSSGVSLPTARSTCVLDTGNVTLPFSIELVHRLQLDSKVCSCQSTGKRNTKRKKCSLLTQGKERKRHGVRGKKKTSSAWLILTSNRLASPPGAWCAIKHCQSSCQLGQAGEECPGVHSNPPTASNSGEPSRFRWLRRPNTSEHIYH